MQPIVKKLSGLVLSGMVICGTAFADGGISLQGTRIVYPQKEHQQTISVRNSSSTESFLIQSWVEDAAGHKSRDFIVTPPLYVSAPGNENTMRVMLTNSALPQDRETIYYFVSKAIPSINDDAKGHSVLKLSAANRIKLFVRPAGLKVDIDKAPGMLTFHRAGNKLEINNPTPYYLTMTHIESGGKTLSDIMVAPESKATEILPAGSGNSVSYETIGDYGNKTARQTKSVN